ncbi:MAG: phosphoenolpyruvate carboxykinase (ATP) [Thermodesulfobacteriota bacterium]
MNIPIRPVEAKVLLRNLSSEELRELARKDEKTTEFGSASYITKVRSRSAKNTYIIDAGYPIGVRQMPISQEKAEEIMARVHEYLRGQEVIQVDRTMGMNPIGSFACRLYITKPYARIAHLWYNSLFPSQVGRELDLVSVYVPEWPERIIFTNPQAGFTYILGTDYFGEAKKSFLRKAMYRIKQRGGIGFHAGSKLIRVRGGDGNLREVGFILFGLSGTGKTTLTLHDHYLSEEEGVTIRQDDVVLIREDGYCYGTENGFFIKTEGLEPSQEVLWAAATKPSAAFENIKVYEDGRVDFLDYELTTNGRGVVLRREIASTDGEVDLPKAHKVIFITRRYDIVPIVSKLTPEQAAAYFMLGESIETSAGDPTKAGQSKREVGTNPFIVGPECEEGNRVMEILRRNPDMECFVLNTGRVGKSVGNEGVKITIQVSVITMREIARRRIDWKCDPDWGYLMPCHIEGLDINNFDPHRHYSPREYDEQVERLRAERIQWLAQFPGLDPAIVRSVERP